MDKDTELLIAAVIAIPVVGFAIPGLIILVAIIHDILTWIF